MSTSTTPSAAPAQAGRGRIHPRVALALLEVIQERDRPTEILADEDPTVTMPRRLGLSEVVGAQVRRYRADLKGKRRLRDDEVRDLFQLVLRRPDASDIFRAAGDRLVDGGQKPPRMRKLLPRRLAYFRARREFNRQVKAIFGRRMGAFAPGPFVLEGAGLFLIQADPAGHACGLLTGICQDAMERHLGRGATVRHTHCQSRGDSTCRWVGMVVTPGRRTKTDSGDVPVAAGDAHPADDAHSKEAD